ncbi:MAG: patatin-like phospholipase family protein [Hyphomonas sp.]|uniref:patatin-like phospholipase family protein n=1 Tax=Hyphomonas sp. TaxID=87 RepID=UPI0035297ED9
MAKPVRRPISLALQGGGAHGAYTWGVLDRLVEEEDRIDIQAITATSAGAMNAAAFAAGYAVGGSVGAQATMEALWQAVSRVSSGFSLYGALSPIAFAYASALQSVASPYDLNPLDVNPLRDVLNEVVDFDLIHDGPVKLFICATDVQGGHVKVFSDGEVSADAVLASACLPQTFRAVEIGDKAYWDGGYLGNPSLFPLVYSGAPADVLLVTLNPIRRDGVPKRAGEIQERLNEISFNAALIGELRAIAFVQRLIDEGMLKEPMLKKYRRLNLHAIRGGDDLRDLSLSTKYDTGWRFLKSLRDKGRDAAEAWLKGDAKHLGTKTSNIDLRKEFLEG